MNMESSYANPSDLRDTDLITADRVSGTPVYNRQDEKLGSVDSILIDKVSGKVSYVVMSFGGFLGIGEKYHPLPWNQLQYDTGIGGYRIDLDRSQLEGAPSYDRETVDSFDYGRNAATIDSYYASTGAGFAVPTPTGERDTSDWPDGDRRTSDRRAEDRAPDSDGYYSPDQQAERNRPMGTDVPQVDRETGSDGFYSPEQQAERNRRSDDDTAGRDVGHTDGNADLIDRNATGSTSGDWTRDRR